MRALPSSYDVSAVLHAPAADVARRVGRWAEVEALDEGRCRLSMHTDSLEWAALSLGSAEADLSEVRPPELVAHLARWAERFAHPQ